MKGGEIFLWGPKRENRHLFKFSEVAEVALLPLELGTRL